MSIPQDSDVVVLEKDSKTSCRIHLFGATLISWIADGDEFIFVRWRFLHMAGRLFHAVDPGTEEKQLPNLIETAVDFLKHCSSKAKFDNKSAIRGGVPIVFPNFGPWDQGPQHGFARTSRWSTEQQPKQDVHGDIVAIFSLEDSEETRSMWNNHRFKVTLTVTLSNCSLKMTLGVINKGSAMMNFTCLLHTYFRVLDVALATVSNLKGLSYVDKVKGGLTFVEDRELVNFDRFVDSVYPNTPNEHKVSGLAGGKSVSIEKVNLPDTVVWNPWKEKALQMSDLGEDYIHMLCVEAGHVSSCVELPGNGTFSASQILRVL